MTNPFDLGTYNFPTVSIESTETNRMMDTANSTHIPYLDIELPSTDVTLPTPRLPTNTLNSYISQSPSEQKQPSQKDLLLDELVNTKFKSDRVAYSYNAAMDVRYKDIDFNPNKDMEKIYDEKQSTWDVFTKQTERLVLNAKNTFRDNYIGSGRLVYNLGSGQFNESFFNKPETLASYLSGINEEFYNPIFGKENASWYSMKGWLGDTYASSGFALGSIATGIVDQTIGKGLKAITAHPLGAAAVGLGIAGLFTDTVRDYIGEEAANYTLGLIAGGSMSNLLTTGINKLTKVIPPVSIPAFKQSLVEFKNSKDFSKAMRGVIDNTLTNIKSGTLLDATSELAKSVKVANTINKGLTAGLTGAKMYLSSGAESGMEAIQAQYDYIGEKLKEAQDTKTTLSQEEYLKIYNDGLGMAKDVYNMNRIILGMSNYNQFGDIITGKFVRNQYSKLGIEYVKGKSMIEVVGSPLKSWYKYQLQDSLSEGVEEGSQYIISESSKDYLLNKEKNKSKFDSFMYGVEKTLLTKEGLGNIMSGIVSSLVPSSASNIVRGISEANKGGTFLSGFTGFDKPKAEFIAKQLNTNFKALYDSTINSKESETLLKLNKFGLNVDRQLADQRVKIEQTLFNNAITAIESGNSENIKYFLEDYFTKNPDDKTSLDNYNKLVELYGSEENVEKAKEDILTKINKVESTVKSFQEFYTNPYTITKIDELFDSKLGRQLGLNKETVQARKAKADIYNNMVIGASRALFLHDQHSEQLLIARDEVKKLTNELFKNSKTPPVDLLNYLTGSRNTYKELLEDIDSKIQLIETTEEGSQLFGIDDKVTLQELKELKELLRDEDGLKYEKALESTDKESVEYLSQNKSPVLKLIANIWEKEQSGNNSNPIFRNINKDNIKKLLLDIQELEESVFFLAKDLKSFTSEKQQKSLIEYLYATKLKFATETEKFKKEQEANKIENKKESEITNVVTPPQTPNQPPISNVLTESIFTQQPVVPTPPVVQTEEIQTLINGTPYSIEGNKIWYEKGTVNEREIKVVGDMLSSIITDIEQRQEKEIRNVPKETIKEVTNKQTVEVTEKEIEDYLSEENSGQRLKDFTENDYGIDTIRIETILSEMSDESLSDEDYEKLDNELIEITKKYLESKKSSTSNISDSVETQVVDNKDKIDKIKEKYNEEIVLVKNKFKIEQNEESDVIKTLKANDEDSDTINMVKIAEDFGLEPVVECP